MKKAADVMPLIRTPDSLVAIARLVMPCIPALNFLAEMLAHGQLTQELIRVGIPVPIIQGVRHNWRLPPDDPGSN
jgi:hypothetical protein